MEISNSSTPLNVDKVKQNVMSIESGSKGKGFSFGMDKYTLILIVAIFAFIAGLSFWVFVNFML